MKWGIDQEGRIFRNGRMIAKVRDEDRAWKTEGRDTFYFVGIEVDGVETYQSETSLGTKTESYPTTIYRTSIGGTSETVKFASMEEYEALKPPSASKQAKAKKGKKK